MNKTHTTSIKHSVCPLCGAAFVCGVAAGKQANGDYHCWCFELPPALPVRADTTGLCPTCLTKAIAPEERRL